MNINKLKYLTNQVENKFAFMVQLAIYKIVGKILRTDHSVFRWIVPIRTDGFATKYVFQITKQLSEDDKELYKILRNPKYKVLIDVGSSIGAISDYFLRQNPNRYAFCFEPQPLPVKFSRKYLRCPVYECALSDYFGVGYLYSRGKKYDGKASMILKFKYSYSIDVSPLDVWTFDKKIDLIKYDVEGGEYQAIKGSLKTIEKHKPDIIFENNTGDITDIAELLKDYKITCIGNVSGHKKNERNYFAQCLK